MINTQNNLNSATSATQSMFPTLSVANSNPNSLSTSISGRNTTVDGEGILKKLLVLGEEPPLS